MAESKEASLNNAYYGPAIPPSKPERRRTQLQCEPYPLACMVFKTFTIVLILIGIMALILWLVFLPSDLKVYVENASLTRFDLADNNHTLYYNLTLKISLRNPNSKLGLSYKHIEANAFYGGSRLGFQDFSKLRQSKKSTLVLSPSFQGQALVVGDSVATFRREKGEGFFYLSLKLYTRVKLKTMVFYSVEYRPEVDCYVKLPAPGNDTSSAGGFNTTRCSAEGFS